MHSMLPMPFVDAPPPPLQAPPAAHPTKAQQPPLAMPLVMPMAACRFHGPVDTVGPLAPAPASYAVDISEHVPSLAASPDFTLRSAHASPVHGSSRCTVPFRCATTPMHGRHSGSGLSADYSALVKTAVVDAMDSSLHSADEFDDELGVEGEADAFGSQFARPDLSQVFAQTMAPPVQVAPPHQSAPSPGPCGTKLFVGQIPQRQDAQQWLERLFSPYDVQEVQVRTVPSFDKRGRAWKKPVAAFVWAGSPQMAEAAVAALHDHEYKNGRLWFRLSVELSRSLVPPSFPAKGH